MKKDLLEFLNTKKSKEELKTCLDIILEFKSHCPFDQWVRLEQLEDYLKLLTGTDVDSVYDKKAIDYFNALKNSSA